MREEHSSQEKSPRRDAEERRPRGQAHRVKTLYSVPTLSAPQFHLRGWSGGLLSFLRSSSLTADAFERCLDVELDPGSLNPFPLGIGLDPRTQSDSPSM